MTVAVIDIGTNTVLLLLARMNDDGRLVTVIDTQRVPRLGRDVDARGVLSDKSMERVVGVLREYCALLSPYTIHRLVIAATSAVRDAANRDVFLAKAEEATGSRVETLSGAEEATMAFVGAMSGLSGVDRASVIDIGGGSTEVVTGSLGGITARTSMDIGAVRLTERFLRHLPPREEEEASLRDCVLRELRNADIRNTNGVLVGVAGTVTSLAVLDLGLAGFDRAKVSNHTLSLRRITEIYEQLRKLRPEEIRYLSTVMEGREDIITTGALILRTFMEEMGFANLIVSERGIRYGLALREFESGGFSPSSSGRQPA